MKPEEFEVYVIPPNFMEGGTLFGGLLKTRNTIEAVILGLAVGVPVLHLPFSLTVRVVILCLTALPLVLLALIGVSGMSLSAFIRLFFCFLHNRRILSRDGTQGGKNGKTLLPSWAQQRKSDCEAEDPPLPKSRSRFSVDLKQRSVTQFKTFLQEEEAVQPLNALADYIPIEKIEHGVIYTRDHRYVKVVEVVPVNFLLRSAREQRSIIYSFISYLKIAPVKVQFKALTKRADINRHLDIRDYDNLELKQFLDVAASFILTDDNGLLCDAYNTTELGEEDCTRLFLMDSTQFPAWLAERQNGVKSISDF